MSFVARSGGERGYASKRHSGAVDPRSKGLKPRTFRWLLRGAEAPLFHVVYASRALPSSGRAWSLELRVFGRRPRRT